jgi:hypothetical protein
MCSGLEFRFSGLSRSDFVVCPACSIAGECESPIQPDGRISEAQGRPREVASEGSVEQSRDLTNRNRIRGILWPDERATNREVQIHQGPEL